MEIDINELKELYVLIVIDDSRNSFIDKVNKFNRELHYKAEVDKVNYINQNITAIGEKICSPENQTYCVYSFEMVQLHLKEIEKNKDLQLWRKEHLEIFQSQLKDKLNDDIEYSSTNQFKLQSWAKKYDYDYTKGIHEFASYLVEHLSNVMLSIYLKEKEQIINKKPQQIDNLESIDYYDILFSSLSYEASLVPDFFITKFKEHEEIITEKIFYSHLLTSFNELENRYKDKRIEIRNNSTFEQNFTGINKDEPEIIKNWTNINLSKYLTKLEVSVNTKEINSKFYKFKNEVSEQSCYSSRELKKLHEGLTAYHAIVFPENIEKENVTKEISPLNSTITKYADLKTDEKLKWDIEIIERLFYESISKVNIPLFKDEIGIDKNDKPNSENLEKLYQAKLEAYSGTQELFIKDELAKIEDMPYYIREEYKVINVWHKFLNEKLKTKNSQNVIDKTFQAHLNNTQITSLYEQLKDPENGFILYDSNENSFNKIFKGETLTDNEKIVWLPIAKKGKHPNKLALGDLFILLIERKLITITKSQLTELLPAWFKHNNGMFTPFTFSNLPSDTNYSEHYSTLKKIVHSL